jgi:DNA-directed RNA polymerase subunit RPC12/RpoP
MQGNRCPNCENDLNDAVTAAIIAKLRSGVNGPMPIECPHCGEELVVTASVKTSVERATLSAR